MTTKQRLGKFLFGHLPITRFLFDQLRVELNVFWVWLLNHFSIRQRLRLKEIRNQDNVKVNVACGPHVATGFMNVDLFAAAPEVLRWDCRSSLPLKTGTAAGIRVEHFLEHLEVVEELPGFLADCLRALKPGGVLRVIVPDARKFVQAYLAEDLSGFEALKCPLSKGLPTRMDVVNHVFHQYHEHRWGYDFENLKNRLEQAGFVRIAQMGFQQSHMAELACDRPVHAPYSLYVEGFKP